MIETIIHEIDSGCLQRHKADDNALWEALGTELGTHTHTQLLGTRDKRNAL